MFYYTLANIGPEKQSNLRNIYVLGIIDTQLIKKYSMNTVLKHILKDLLILVCWLCMFYLICSHTVQESGYSFVINGQSVKINGSVCTVSADNPAASSLGGFKESASANHPCRQCMTTHAEMSKMVSH